MLSAVTRFINEAVEELHQVRWPTRQQAVRLSVVVLVFTLISAFIFGFLDFLLSQIVSILVSFASY